MPANGVTIKSPLKGVEKNMAWGDHTPDAAIDALNVLPFDLGGRNRLIQRPGTSKLLASAIGSGNPVMALAQTTIPLDPANVTATSTAFTEAFAYSNGNLGTVAAANWTCYDTPGVAPGTNNVTSAGAWIINSGIGVGAVPFDTSGKFQTAVWNGSSALGSTYTLKATIRFSGTGTGSVLGTGFVTRVSPITSFSNTQVIVACMNQHHITIYQNTGTVLGSLVVAHSAATDYLFELRVTRSGGTSTYTVFVDGVQALQVTGIADTSAVNNGVGFYNGQNTNVQVKSFVALTKPALSVYRQTNIVAAAGGNVYVGDRSALTVATSGTGVLDINAKPQFTYSAGKGWFVDGTNIRQVDIASATVETYTATAGTAPTGCTLAAMYRDRLVLAAPYATPHLFFCSRVGTKTDWDYSQTDPAAAFAGNASTAGRIGDPISALMPASDDILYIGGDHTLYAIRGDPADGGSIDLISDGIGVLGANAWTKAPDGTIYFIGNAGLYRMAGGQPENLSSGTWNEYFRQLDRSANHITLVWDRDHHGLYLFVTSVATGASTHLFWDSRGGGFWPIQFPNTWGPLSAMVFDGDGPGDRVTLLGSRTGFIYRMYDTDGGDDTTAVSSYAYLGPFTDNDLTENTAEWFDVILGEPASFHTTADWNVTVTVQAGPTPERAYASPERTVSRTYAGSARKQTRWRQRIRGVSFVVKLANATVNKTWAFERIVAMMLPTGIVRRNK